VSDFFQAGPASDDAYRAVRDGNHPYQREARAFVEDIWRVAEPYVDDECRTEARNTFSARFWEVYLAAALVAGGVELVKRRDRPHKDAGPDLLLTDGRTWIEATAPTCGTGLDALPETHFGEGGEIPDDAIKLRYLGAISEKVSKWTHYQSKGVVASDDRFIIAINSRAIPAAGSELEIPRIVRCVFPFGGLLLHLNAETLEIVRSEYGFQGAVAKRSGTTISTKGFLTDEYACVSALLHAHVDALNHPSDLSAAFVWVHNYRASFQLERGLLPVGREYWGNERELVWHDHARMS